MPLAWITTSIVALEKEGEGGDMRNSNASQFKKRIMKLHFNFRFFFVTEEILYSITAVSNQGS